MSLGLWNLDFIDQCIQRGILSAFITTYMFFEENVMALLKDTQWKYMENHPVQRRCMIWVYMQVLNLQSWYLPWRFSRGIWRMDSLDSALKHYDEVSITAQHIKEACDLWMFFFVNLSKTLFILFILFVSRTKHNHRLTYWEWISEPQVSRSLMIRVKRNMYAIVLWFCHVL